MEPITLSCAERLIDLILGMRESTPYRSRGVIRECMLGRTGHNEIAGNGARRYIKKW
jgi:hypothetical protein